MNELDVVALKTDRPDLGLKAGDCGTIVMKFNDIDLLVEFSDDDGQEFAMPTLKADEVEVVWRVGDPVTNATAKRRASL